MLYSALDCQADVHGAPSHKFITYTTYTFNFHANNVTRLNEGLRLHTEPDTRGRTGQNNIAWQQSEIPAKDEQTVHKSSTTFHSRQ